MTRRSIVRYDIRRMETKAASLVVPPSPWPSPASGRGDGRGRFRALRPGPWALILLLGLVSGCNRSVHEGPRANDLRLVSFSPAITDMLFDLGLGDQIVGVSRYCLVPPGYRIKVVGDMVSADAELLLSVKPTHLFFQAAADRFKNLVERDPAIQLVPIRLETIADIGRVVREIGALTGRGRRAEQLAESFNAKIAGVRRQVKGLPSPRVLFLLDSGRHGILAAGPGTFVDELITACGAVNAGRDLSGKPSWRRADRESLLASRPEILICQVDPSEPEGRRRAQEQWSRYLGEPTVSLKRVEIVSDARWTFPSTRVADLAESMARIIHPSLKQ